MPSMGVFTNGDHRGAAREAGADHKPVLHTTTDWVVDAIAHGMVSGATSLMVLIPVTVDKVLMPGQQVVVAAETSLNVWMMASATLRAAFRDEVEQPGWATLSPAARAVLLPRFVEALRRAKISLTVEEATDAAEMILDGIGADRPIE